VLARQHLLKRSSLTKEVPRDPRGSFVDVKLITRTPPLAIERLVSGCNGNKEPVSLKMISIVIDTDLKNIQFNHVLLEIMYKPRLKRNER